jgi:hypothetical protein
MTTKIVFKEEDRKEFGCVLQIGKQEKYDGKIVQFIAASVSKQG